MALSKNLISIIHETPPKQARMILIAEVTEARKIEQTYDMRWTELEFEFNKHQSCTGS